MYFEYFSCYFIPQSILLCDLPVPHSSGAWADQEECRTLFEGWDGESSQATCTVGAPKVAGVGKSMCKGTFIHIVLGSVKLCIHVWYGLASFPGCSMAWEKAKCSHKMHKPSFYTTSDPRTLYIVDIHLCSVTFSLKKGTSFFTSTVVGFTSTGPSASGVYGYEWERGPEYLVAWWDTSMDVALSSGPLAQH